MGIQVDKLSFAYGRHQVLKDITVDFPDRTLVSVLGANGAGKSTLFRCILGLEHSYQGSIIVNGKNMRSLSTRQRAREIAYIPQSHSSIYDYDVIDVVMMSSTADIGYLGQPRSSHAERAYGALQRVGIEHLARRPYTQISGGEQQLVLIARAISQAAHTIIMDEPTSALDFGNTVRVLSTVQKLAEDGLSIVQSTHQPDHALRYSDKTLVIHNGGVYAYGAPRDVITADMVSAIYHVDVEVASLHGDSARVCVPAHSRTVPARP